MSLGEHAIVDLYDCNISNIDDLKEIKKIIIESVNESNLHVVKEFFYKFNPIGISGVLILLESHLTIHTWPEYNFVALDVFTCGKHFNPKEVCSIIAKKLKSDKYVIKLIERGIKYGL